MHQLFKLNYIYLDSEMTVKIQQFQLLKNKKAKQHVSYCKSVVYTVNPVPYTDGLKN